MILYTHLDIFFQTSRLTLSWSVYSLRLFTCVHKTNPKSIRFLTSICLSVHPPACRPICPHGTSWIQLDRFSWNLYWQFLLQYVKVIQVWLQLNKITDTLCEDLCTFTTTPVTKITTDFLVIKFTFITVTSATIVTNVNEVHWLIKVMQKS